MPVTANAIVTSQAVKSAQCVATAAKTTYNDATNAVLLMTAGANGAVVYGLKALARATVALTQLQLYRSPDNGTTLNLIGVQAMAAYTMAQTTAQPAVDFGFGESVPLRLAANERLYFAIGVALAGGVVADVQYEDL